MAPFEEKVLAYLDGSLPAAEREEVMRAVSISPDRRALLDAHLRMNDLFTIVQKPISAPLYVQRDLAKQLPILAAKLPYLATQNRRRGAAMFGFFGRMASGLGSSRASTIGAVLLAIGLVSGGVWYIVNQSQRNNSSSPVQSSNAVASNGAPGMGAPTAALGNGGSGSAGVGGTSVPGGGSGSGGAANNLPHGNSSSMGGGSGAGSHGVVVGDTVSRKVRYASVGQGTEGTQRTDRSDRTNISALPIAVAADNLRHAPIRLSSENRALKNHELADNSNANSSSKNIANQNGRNADHTDQSKIDSKASNDISAQSTSNVAQNSGSSTDTKSSNDIASQSVSNSDRDAKTISSTPPAATPAKPPVENPPADVTSVSLPDASIAKAQSHSIPIRYSLQEDDKSYVPMHVFVVPKVRLVSAQSTPLSSYTSANSIGAVGTKLFGGVEAGVEYEVSPWFSAGVRGGLANFLQIQPYTHAEIVHDYKHLTQQISDAEIASISAFWFGPALTYMFNPEADVLRFSATLSGGEVFLPSGNAQIGMIETSGVYALSNSFSLQGGLSFDMSWTPQYAVTSSTSTNPVVGILQQGPSLASLRSTAVGISLGVVFKP